MALQKKEYSTTLLSDLSVRALDFLETLPEFIHANIVAVYYAMADEVRTADFIEKWAEKKKILLPLIADDMIRFYTYKGADSLKSGVFGILEPVPDEDEYICVPDLVVVPGVAFDRQMNRLGRGKGYYDRLFMQFGWREVTKIGLCFHFQLISEVPVGENDVRMHHIVTDETILSGSFS
ncbi:MAG: 5-formyltetrahydrofolate cyclo-ligase [Massilibacteroides sp.]|nr:5-formyltetrahydrofolate cyclo-ligase [Massilibacteroides sp.]MDD4659511.1 5-formyltetrahydrofolate cyclo-ligase [Massilibacteroides sp.]